jgi:NADH:ubiquinone oxidoreductase subunit E
MNIDIKDIDIIVNSVGKEKKHSITILQAIQKKYNYLHREAMEHLCDITELTPASVVSVASFYSQFRFTPAGDHMIKVCVGTACHVKGSEQVYDAIKRELKLEKDQDTTASRKYTIEKVNCLGCCTLAPVVQIDRVTYGHVNTSNVKDILIDFESQGEKDIGKKSRKSFTKEIQGEIRIGLGSCCVASGSDEIRNAVSNTIDRNQLYVKLKHVGCVGMCHQVPLVEIVPYNQTETILYSKVKAVDVEQIVKKHFRPQGFWKKISSNVKEGLENIVDDGRWNGVERYELNIREKHVSSFLGKQIPVATEFRGIINPVDIDEYLSRKGFTAMEKCLSKMKPDEVIGEIIQSGIRGRGGGGFPTGKKWQTVATQKNNKKYVICNGDEGDPGAFMDRMLLESYPYRIIEGIIIAGYAVGADEGILYIRAEYPLAVQRIQEAIDICYNKGYVGENILGSGFSFDLSIYQGAGAFVCGE